MSCMHAKKHMADARSYKQWALLEARRINDVEIQPRFNCLERSKICFPIASFFKCRSTCSRLTVVLSIVFSLLFPILHLFFIKGPLSCLIYLLTRSEKILYETWWTPEVVCWNISQIGTFQPFDLSADVERCRTSLTAIKNNNCIVNWAGNNISQTWHFRCQKNSFFCFICDPNDHYWCKIFCWLHDVPCGLNATVVSASKEAVALFRTGFET